MNGPVPVTASSSWLVHQCEHLVMHRNHNQPVEPQCHGFDVFKKEQQTLRRELDEGNIGDIAENAFSERFQTVYIPEGLQTMD